MTRDDLRAALQDPNVLGFLHVIRAGESSQDDSAYTVIFGGGHFDGFADHPRQSVTVGSLTSTAAGAYQFLAKTWDGLVAQYHFPDFTPSCQDEAAVALIAGRGALADVQAGRIDVAINKCAKEWASLPGSPYGQPTMTIEKALEVYAQFGGSLADAPAVATTETPIQVPTDAEVSTQTTTTTRNTTMAPILAAVMPTIMGAIPELAKLFGGTEVSDRNAAAAAKVAEIVQTATGAVNEQDAATKIVTDTTARDSARKAIQDNWFQLVEIGQGGIAAARQADAAFVAAGRPFYSSPAFVIACLLLPLAYMVTSAVVFQVGGEWPDAVRASIASSVISLILGSLVGYYYGASTSANRPTK